MSDFMGKYGPMSAKPDHESDSAPALVWELLQKETADVVIFEF